ncbi:hypothetical protein DERP_005305 [Dermatophagoides pteronyssinus]|uniref:Uncharacterized protein n=1 Tax=Dermatophagoides pteronyssinus TaxID=6956 RepID=A0ABQ8JM77_DERPT|nr:hypothetical protein DERP_005305 [Dermatophagoides pteronyssinus]
MNSKENIFEISIFLIEITLFVDTDVDNLVKHTKKRTKSLKGVHPVFSTKNYYQIDEKTLGGDDFNNNVNL